MANVQFAVAAAEREALRLAKSDAWAEGAEAAENLPRDNVDGAVNPYWREGDPSPHRER